MKSLSVNNLTEEQLEIVERHAKIIVKYGLGTVTILWLDSLKYMSFLGSQVLQVANPILTLIPYFKDFDKVAEMMEDEENVDYFLTRIEHYMNEEDKIKNKNKKDKKRKKREKKKKK